MPTRKSPRHAPLSRVLYYFHPLQCPYGTIALFSSHGGGPTPTPAHFPFLLLRHWLSRAKLCCFSAKSDRCDSRARHSDGPKRYKLASMQFNTFAEVHFSPFAEIVSRCGEIRSDRSLLGTRSAENHEKSMVFIKFLDDATRLSQTKKSFRSKCVEGSAANFIAPEHA